MNRNCNLVKLEKILISFHTSIRMLNFILAQLYPTLEFNLYYIEKLHLCYSSEKSELLPVLLQDVVFLL